MRLDSVLITPMLIDIIDKFFNNDVIMSSLVTNLNSSTVHKIIATDDGCVHTADATQLDS